MKVIDHIDKTLTSLQTNQQLSHLISPTSIYLYQKNAFIPMKKVGIDKYTKI